MRRLSPIFAVFLVACSAEVRQGPGDAETCSGECRLEEVEDGGGGHVASEDGGGPVVSDDGGGGGISGVEVECVDHDVPTLPEWEPRAVSDTSPADQLAAAREALVGDWRGVVTNPWSAPYEVVASFRADGGYSARCVYNSDNDGNDIEGCCRAFYYGSDLESDLKELRLQDVAADGSFRGEIDIAFCYEGEECYLPAWQGEVDDLRFDVSGDRLRFEFWRSDGYGAVSFDLERTP